MDSENAAWEEETMMWGGHDHDKQPNIGTKCVISPHIMMNSHGVWEQMDYGFSRKIAFWEYPLPRLQIMILSTFVLWRFFDILFRKLGFPIPKFTSMMLAGAVLNEAGQTIQMSWFQHIFISDSYMANVAEVIGKVAFILNWFMRGVTTDVSKIKKSGRKSVVIGVATILIPWFIGLIILSSRKKSGILTMTDKEYSIAILTVSMTPFTCINTLLQDLKIIHTEFGQVAQSSAMVTDMVAFSVILLHTLKRHTGTRSATVLMIFLVFMYLVRKAMFWVIKNTPQGVPVKNMYIYIILLLAYLSYLYWDRFLFFGPLGAFALGLAIPDGPPLGSLLIQKFDSFNEGILLPLFGSLTMIKLDWSFQEFANGKNGYVKIYESLSFLSILHIAKLATSFLTSMASRMPLRDSLLLGVVIGTKSSFELANILHGFESNFICLEIFTVYGIYILVNSLLAPVAIHFLYDRSKKFVSYGKRNLNYKPGLQTLVCIEKPDNITSMISLLRAISPTRESPLECFVLHLVELVGQATPTYISHELQKPKPGSRSYSENVISSFQQFQEVHYQEFTSTHMFTSLTYASEMHDHVCWFALNKNVNLILLSFHRTWGISGTGTFSDDQNMRSLNLNVQKRAPCSVGILVYRKPIWQPKFIESPCRVCMIYVDGNDDKEAMALAEQMKGNEHVRLTVLQLIPSFEKNENTVGNQSPTVYMRRNEERSQENSVEYMDCSVADGMETSRTLHSIAYDYDLFLVGRRSGIGTAATKGFEEWMEFEELGIIGDLLASQDFPSIASVLVIQHEE